MTIYQREKKHWLKWVLGLVLFLLVLTVTFDSVYGLGIPPATGSSHGYSGSNMPDWYNYHLDRNYYPVDDRPAAPDDPTTPPQVPEPTTLLLFAAGYGALRLMRQRKAKNI